MEDISSPEVAADAAMLAVDLVDLAEVADFPVDRRVDEAPGICPSSRTSSFRSGRTAVGAYSTGPDSGSLA